MRKQLTRYLVGCLVFLLPLLGLLPVYCHADIPVGYYDSADGLEKEALKQALYHIIKGHKQFDYGEVWNMLRYTDQDPGNPENVIFLYSGWSKSKFSNGGGASQWNREHVWAKSHGGFGTAKGPGTDGHHLRPTDVTVNSKRGNLDFDEGGELYTDPDGPTRCRVDGDSWEPADGVKGDVARMLFYMATRYEGEGNEPDLELNNKVDNGGTPRMGKLSVLVQWHRQDPVDDWERRRNQRVFEWQENRNPFIDHPEYVEYIWGDSGGTEPSGQLEISDVTVNVKAAEKETVVSWSTNTAANSVVYYGTSPGLLVEVAFDETQGKQHSVTLKNLKSGVTYYFSVASAGGSESGPVYSPVHSFNLGSGGGSADGTGIVITEIAANPGGSYKNEFIELHNTSDKTIDVSNWDVIVHRQGASDVVVKLGVTGNHRGSPAIAPGGFYVITRGTVAYANKTMYDGFYLNRMFYVELKQGNKVKDAAGEKNDRFSPGLNYELEKVNSDNAPLSAWKMKGASYKGTAGHILD